MRIQEDPLRPCLGMRMGLVEARRLSPGFYQIVLTKVAAYGVMDLGLVQRIDNDDLGMHGWEASHRALASPSCHKTIRDAVYWLLEQSGSPFAPYAAPKNPDLKEREEDQHG